MLDSRLRRLIDPPLDRIGATLGRRGIAADAVTLAGFAVGIASWAALAMETIRPTFVAMSCSPRTHTTTRSGAAPTGARRDTETDGDSG